MAAGHLELELELRELMGAEVVLTGLAAGAAVDGGGAGPCSGRNAATIVLLVLLLLISAAEHPRYRWFLVTVRGPTDRRVHGLDEATVFPGAKRPRRRRRRCGRAVRFGRSQGDAF